MCWGVLQELAKLIKTYQARVNDLSEKSHFLVERSSDLGPLCVRRLYHTGEHQVRVSDLMNTLNAPLEPYISPLSSPLTPEKSLTYQYENPLKVYKGEEIGPVELSALEAGYEPMSVVGNKGPRRTRDAPSSGGDSLPASDTERIDPSVNVPNLSRPWSASKRLPKDNSSKTDLSVKLKNLASPHTEKPTNDFSESQDSAIGISNGFSPSDSGMNFSTPRDSGTEGRQPISDMSAIENLPMEISIQIPPQYSTPPKRTHSSDRDSGGQHSGAKSLRSSGDRGSNLSLGSVISGSTDDPKSSISHGGDLDGADTSSLSSHPISSHGRRSPVHDTTTSQPAVSEELKALQKRKEEALSPYTPRSKYLSSKLGQSPEITMPTKDTESAKSDSTKGPMRGEHGKFDNMLPVEEPITKTQAAPRESRSYRPRSPSPLTLDNSSKSGKPPRSRSSEKARTDSLDGIHRQSRSMSPKDGEGRQSRREEPLSKSLTSGQLRSMSRSGADKRKPGAWSSVGGCFIVAKCQ